MAKHENPSKSEIAPNPPNVSPPAPPSPGDTGGQNAPQTAPHSPPMVAPNAGTPISPTGVAGAPGPGVVGSTFSPPVMSASTAQAAALNRDLTANQADELAAARTAARPRTLEEIAAVPSGPKEIPTQPGDPKQIRPKATMGGLSFVNDHVEPGTTTLTPDHANPLATPEQKRASEIKTIEDADLAQRRREHARGRDSLHAELDNRGGLIEDTHRHFEEENKTRRDALR